MVRTDRDADKGLILRYHASMSTNLDKIFELATQLLVVVVIPLLSYWVQAYIRSAKTRDAFAMMSQHVLTAVQRLNKTRRELRDPSKPGQWTESEAARLREAALREVKTLLGDSVMVLVNHLGNEGKVDQAILRSIDAAAESTRSNSTGSNAGATPSAPPSAPPAPPALPTEPSAAGESSSADDTAPDPVPVAADGSGESA